MMEFLPGPQEQGPSDNQKRRLEGYLGELTYAARRWGIILMQDTHDRAVFVDKDNGKVLGYGLHAFVSSREDAHPHVDSYAVEHSILDGVWE